MSDQSRERTATEQEAPATADASPVSEPAKVDTAVPPSDAAGSETGTAPETEAEAKTEPETGAEAGAEAEGSAESSPAEAEQPSDGDQQIEADLDELNAKAQKADEYLDLAKRTQADFENYRKRAVRDAALAKQRGIATLAKELLPAIDNLERALAAAQDAHQQIAEGIELTQSELLAALSRVGIESFAPKGEPFDPTVHEAVVQQPAEGVESGTVIEVFQTGYRLGELVLRPARVMVAA